MSEVPLATSDRLGRPLRNLRLSVTDRCNLRCSYCMPEENYRWLPNSDILSFEEVSALVDCFLDLGVRKVRLTGGEPLIRRELPILIELLARKERLQDLALTTNGVLLASQAAALKQAGLHRITISLDTLKPDRFLRLTRRDGLDNVLAGIESAHHAGFADIKIDTVLIRGVNHDELDELLRYGQRLGAEVRFIEYMDVGGATRWSFDQVVSRQEILRFLTERYGPLEPLPDRASTPAERFRLANGTVFGIIASTTAPFCRACDRSRITADGRWYRCLYSREGTDLKGPLRQGASPSQLRQLIRQQWASRSDRGAEERLALHPAGRAALFQRGELEANPHLEMHTRGG